MKLTKYLGISLFFICFTEVSRAQEKVRLLVAIASIEERFEVKFSYSVRDVEQIFVDQPKEFDSLESIIENLIKSTTLNFKFITNRYIAISVADKTVDVCGYVFIDESKLPLYGASVYTDEITKGVITDDNGRFSITQVQINETIHISFLGFESKSIKASELFTSTSCQKFFLVQKSEALNNIIISKFLTTGLQKRIDGSTVLNTEKFGILPGLSEPDILQSIQALPGVESVNESIANINIRGGTNDQNLMVWDDIKMYHSGHFFGLISAYNPYLTDKVVVTKNGTSSEYSDGVSSTVSMFTKNEINRTFSGGFGANLLHGDAFFEIPINSKLALHVSGRRSFSDVFETPTYDSYFERSFQDSEISINNENLNESNNSSQFLFYDYSAKLLFNLNEKHKFRANIIGIYNNLDYNENLTDNQTETESKTSNLKQENLGIGGSWKAQWNNKFSTDLNAYYSKYNVDALDFRTETDQRLTQINEVLETGIKLKANYNINSNLSLVNGYQFTEVGILNGTTVNAPSYSRAKRDVLLNHALFSEIEFNNGKTYLRTGIRANYFQKFSKLIIEPRLNFRQKISNNVAVKLKGELKNQSATQIIDFQDNFLGVENRRWILANEQSIPISESKQGSFGIEFNKNNFLIDVEGFYKNVDGITVSNQGFYNNFQFINAIGSYDVKGIELLINKTAIKYSAWLSYTYSINDYEFETLNPSVFPNNIDIRHSVSLAFNYDVFKKLKISFGGIWRSGQPFTKPVEGNETVQDGNNTFVNYDIPNSENLDDFFRIDASINYLLSDNGSLQSFLRIGVLNILNQKNIINTYYQVDPNDSNSTIAVINKALGFTPNISLRCKF